MWRAGAREVARIATSSGGGAARAAGRALAASTRVWSAGHPHQGWEASRRPADAGPSRGFAHASAPSLHGHGHVDPDAETITVTFIEKDGTETVVQVRPLPASSSAPHIHATTPSPDLPPALPHPQAPIGQSMLEVAHRNDIELEGACEGSLACSTCHVVIRDQSVYDKLPEPDDDENDMLDLAFGLTETSRLGCQGIAAREIDGMALSLPKATRNFAVDGFVPKPH